MKKNMLRKVTSLAVASAMVASLGVSAFAITADETAKAIAITKDFQMPVGTTTPAETFTYSIEPVDSYYESADLDEETTTETISYTAEDQGTAEGDVKTVTKSIDFLDNYDFPHAGHYKFKVTETAGSTAGITYDDSVLYVYVDVANSEDGSTYIKNIVVTEEGEDGTENKIGSGDTTGVEDTDNDKGATDETAWETYENPVTFTNTYVKTTDVTPDGKDPTDPEGTVDDTGFFVQKNVSGDYADKTQTFDFTVTVTKPSLSTKTTYTAVIIDLDENNAQVGEAITFTSGTAQTIQLTDQQRLVFTDLDIGATYTVDEAAVDNYTESIAGGAETGTASDTANNYVKYLNTYDDEGTTPTGILINNMPYILLAVLTVGGLTAYVVRKRKVEE